jgi:hypothetical protein
MERWASARGGDGIFTRNTAFLASAAHRRQARRRLRSGGAAQGLRPTCWRPGPFADLSAGRPRLEGSAPLGEQGCLLVLRWRRCLGRSSRQRAAAAGGIGHRRALRSCLRRDVQATLARRGRDGEAPPPRLPPARSRPPAPGSWRWRW